MKYTHGVAVKPEPQKVKERVKEEDAKEASKGPLKRKAGGQLYERTENY